jgi:nicotinamide-nucleotide amidase
MKRMMTDQVVPRVNTLLGPDRQYYRIRTLSSFGLPESRVGEILTGLPEMFPQVKVGTRARFPEIQVRLYHDSADEQKGIELLDAAARWVVENVGSPVFSTKDQTMAQTVGELLLKRKTTIAVAESCTGGLIANWLTNTAGSSEYFLMGAVTYANSAKIKVLGVSQETLDTVGAVDEHTAREMAEGVRRVSGADFGLATTGIAGPDGSTDEKPVGTICLALASAGSTVSHRHVFHFGRRLMNKRVFATTALDLLRRTLLDDADQ